MRCLPLPISVGIFGGSALEEKHAAFVSRSGIRVCSKLITFKTANVRFGSKATFCVAEGMSALPPKADIRPQIIDVR
jgi:hypothetical protein